MKITVGKLKKLIKESLNLDNSFEGTRDEARRLNVCPILQIT